MQFGAGRFLLDFGRQYTCDLPRNFWGWQRRGRGQGENKASACFGSATEFSENSTRNPLQYSTAEIRREKGCEKRSEKKSEKIECLSKTKKTHGKIHRKIHGKIHGQIHGKIRGEKSTAKIHGRRKGYGTKGGGEGLEVFLFLLSGEGETRLEFVIECQHYPKIHPIEKKSAPKIRQEVQGDAFLW